MAFELFRMAGSIILNTSEALSGLSNIENAATRTGKVMSAVGSKISSAGKALTLGMTVPIVAALGKSIMLASDLAESANVVNVTFGKSAKQVTDWSKTLNEKFGIVQLEAMNYVGSMGAMLKSSGLSTKASKDMAKGLVELTGDMSSFYNLSHEATWEKIRSGIGGETEPLKALGINMSVANMEAYALSQGIKKPWKEMKQAEQTQLRYNYLMKVTSSSHGDFARTSTGFANKLRLIQGRLTELGTKIGSLLLPYVEKILIFIDKWAEKFSKLDAPAQKIIIAVGLLAAVLGPAIWIFGSFAGAIGSIITVVGMLAGALGSLSAPVLIVGGITGTIIAVFLAWKLGTTDLKTVVINAFNAIKDKIMTAAKFIKEHIGDIKEAFRGLIKGIKTGDFTTFTAAINNMIPDSAREKIGNIITKIIQFRNKVIEIKDKIIDFATTVKNKATPIIDLIVKSIKGMDWKPVIESFKQLKTSIIPLIPFLKQLGKIFGTTLAVAVGIVIGAFNGIINVIPTVIATVTSIIGVVVSVFGMIRGLITGDQQLIHKSFVNLFKNIGNVFKNSFKTIIGFVKGFVDGVITWFKSLYNKVVGHSIIPDMVNSIVNWFKKLPSKIRSILSSLVSSAISKFNSLKSRAISSISSFINSAISKISSFVSNFISKIAGLPGKAASKFNSLKSKASSILGGIAKSAFSWGKNLISSFISGITSKLGALKSTLSNTAGKVKNFLGFHSPTKEGPGKDSDTWMPNLMKMLSESMLSKRSLLQDSVKKIAGDISFDKVSADIGINAKTGNNGALTGAGRPVNININNPQIFDRRGVKIVAEQIKTELQAYMNFKKG